MRRVLGFSLSLLALVSMSAGSIEAGSSSKTLATISGIVTDNKGNPLAGALVSLLREGAVKQTVKHTLTDRQGKVLYENPAYLFREEYQVSRELSSFFEEDSPALERLSREFARTLVSNVLEGF